MSKYWIVEKINDYLVTDKKKFKTYYEAKKYYDSIMIPNKNKIYRIYEDENIKD